MATAAAENLTVEEFEEQYGQEKPNYEYWHGKAVAKAMPTWLHGLLQGILIRLLTQAGYRAGAEVKLKLRADWQPVPDVIATRGPIELPYPTKPVDAVLEILLPEDSFQRVTLKCRTYAAMEIRAIFVIDPDARLVWQWVEESAELLITDVLLKIPAGTIFAELDRELSAMPDEETY